MGGLVSKTTTNAHRELEMGFLDKAKDLAEQHADTVDSAVDKAGDLIDDKTEGKHADKVDQAQAFVKDKLQED